MRRAVGGALVVALGCSLGTEPEEVRELGVIAIAGSTWFEDPKIEVPDTVEQSSPVRVGVTTYGDGCVRKGETEIEVQDSVVVVTPYDYRRKGVACTAALVSFAHEATLRFAAPGTARVAIRGREGRSGGLIRVERKIIVR